MNIEQEKKCLITDWPAFGWRENHGLIFYTVKKFDKSWDMSFPRDFERTRFIAKHQHIIKALMYNDKLKPPEEKLEGGRPYFYSVNSIETAIKSANYPRDIIDKKNSVLLDVNKSFEHFGQMRTIIWMYETSAYELYLHNEEEYKAYLDVLEEEELIKRYKDGSTKITLKGFIEIERLQRQGSTSRNCFVAMSFKPDMKPTREAIRAAITSCGYNPILIDEEQIEDGKTINDAMIATMRRCKFLVADFTKQNQGVYFETGFMLGLGRPVIYLCEERDWESTHFDTNRFPHIKYSSLEELEKQLSDRINAWIE